MGDGAIASIQLNSIIVTLAVALSTERKHAPISLITHTERANFFFKNIINTVAAPLIIKITKMSCHRDSESKGA